MSFPVIKTILNGRPSCPSVNAWAMLIAMANRADDDGNGVWESIPSLGRMSGMNRRTAFRAKSELEKAGIVAWTGRWHANGHRQPTKEYSLDLGKVSGLEEMVTEQHQCQTDTSDNSTLVTEQHQCQSDTSDNSTLVTERHWWFRTTGVVVLNPWGSGPKPPKPLIEHLQSTLKKKEGGRAAAAVIDAEVVEPEKPPEAPPSPEPEVPFPVRAAHHLWKTCLHYARFKKLLPAWEKEMAVLSQELGEDTLRGVLKLVRKDGFWKDALMQSPNPMESFAKWLRRDKDGSLLDKYERSKAIEAAPPPKETRDGKWTGNSSIDKKFQLVEHNKALANAAHRYLEEEVSRRCGGLAGEAGLAKQPSPVRRLHPGLGDRAGEPGA